jgi:hypothetical protein
MHLISKGPGNEARKKQKQNQSEYLIGVNNSSQEATMFDVNGGGAHRTVRRLRGGGFDRHRHHQGGDAISPLEAPRLGFGDPASGRASGLVNKQPTELTQRTTIA